MVERFLIALALVGLVDAVSYMIVTPSLIFYVVENGGNKEIYGVILSCFSLASFCTKPFLGHWSDVRGFRSPYMVALAIAAVGGLLYFFASAVKHGPSAIGMIVAGRLLGGVGSASTTLAFGYMARAVPHDRQTQINSILSMVRILGMSAGPGVNVGLSQIHSNWFGLPINNLNSVGLVLVGINVFAFGIIAVLLEEPKVDYSVHHHESTEEEEDGKTKKGWLWLLRSVWCVEILVPILSIFTFNANFQLIETGFAPAAAHALGWGPVETSAVLGSCSIVIFIVMFVVFELSRLKIKDENILAFGLLLSMVGYILVWAMWVADTATWKFVIPVVVSCSSFPFLAAPTRSLFTKAVDNIEVLDGHQGTMQAVLSMAASVAGFAAPSLIAAFVVRTKEEVEASPSHRELTPLALFAPALSGCVLLGSLWIRFRAKMAKKAVGSEDTAPKEATALLPPPAPADESKEIKTPRARKFKPRVEMHRGSSATMMGISQHSIHAERFHDDEEEEATPPAVEDNQQEQIL